MVKKIAHWITVMFCGIFTKQDHMEFRCACVYCQETTVHDAACPSQDIANRLFLWCQGHREGGAGDSVSSDNPSYRLGHKLGLKERGNRLSKIQDLSNPEPLRTGSI